MADEVLPHEHPGYSDLDDRVERTTRSRLDLRQKHLGDYARKMTATVERTLCCQAEIRYPDGGCHWITRPEGVSR